MPFNNGPLADAKNAGTAIVDSKEKVFPEIKANAGEKAITFMHTIPFEGSVGLVNMLTTTRVLRKGFDTTLVLYGPGVLMAAGGRGYPNVGDVGMPGGMMYNNQLSTFMKEGGKIYACRFALAGLYGYPEDMVLEGVKPFNPLDVLDIALTAWRGGWFQLNTWTN